MSQRWKTTYLPVCLCLMLGGLLLFHPESAAQGFQSGLLLCIQTVLPALFPFFVVCDLLLSCPMHGRFLHFLARLFGLRSQTGATVILLSWLGGYAVCAQLTGQLYHGKMLSKRESTLVMMIGCCSSPGFVISCVGGLLLGNLQLGILLYVLQLAANLLSTLPCLPFLPSAESSTSSDIYFDGTPSVSRAISNSVTSSLQVCGCVLFFRVVAAIVLPYLPSCLLAAPVLSGILEISSGCADFSALGGQVALYGCCACLSLLGLSVWSQLSLLLQGATDLRLLLLHRSIHLVCYLLLVRLFAPCLPGTTAVYRTLADRVIPTGRLPVDAAAVCFVFLCAALYKVQQNFYNK